MRLIFIGDSLIEYFDWQDRFPDDFVSNFGISGETVQELEFRCERVFSEQEQPDWLFIMIGTNNLAMEDYSFMPSYENIIDTAKNSFPNTKIVVTGLFPMRLAWISSDAIPQVNENIKELANDKDVYYMDGVEIFTAASQGAPLCFMEDGVHLSDCGYRVWSDAVEKQISDE